MRTSTPLRSKDPALVPGGMDPEITRAQLREVKAWLEKHQILVGDWIRVFRVPGHGAFSTMIMEGADLYQRGMNGCLVNPKFLEKIHYDDSFCRAGPEPKLISLRTRPFGGSDKPLPQIRSLFAASGRKIASTPEVVAGFVAYHVAVLVPSLDYRARQQELHMQGKGGWLSEPIRGVFAQGFAPSTVFRSASQTLAYNSQVGIQLHDFPADRGDPNLYVVERL